MWASKGSSHSCSGHLVPGPKWAWAPQPGTSRWHLTSRSLLRRRGGTYSAAEQHVSLSPSGSAGTGSLGTAAVDPSSMSVATVEELLARGGGTGPMTTPSFERVGARLL